MTQSHRTRDLASKANLLHLPHSCPKLRLANDSFPTSSHVVHKPFGSNGGATHNGEVVLAWPFEGQD